MFKNCFLSLLVLLCVLSCKKDDLNSPVKTELLLEMEVQQDQPDDKLIVNGASFMLQELSFAGYRESAENYFFTVPYTDTLKVEFTKTKPGSVLSFEMPQGVYSRIELDMKLPAGKESALGSGVLHRAAIRGGIQIWGDYVNTHDEEIPFIFVYTAIDELSFKAKAKDGSQQVVVKDKANYKASLKFNPDLWMDLINPRMLQSAKLANVNGVPTIIISKSQNEHIYNLLANRIDKSATLLFE